MNNLLPAIGTISFAIVIGSIVFQSFVVAPVVFGQLDPAQARSVLRTLFPRFFRLNATCAIAAAAAFSASGALQGWSGAAIRDSVAAAGIAACMLVSLGLVPAINAARDGGETSAPRFKSLHKVTVMLTIVALLLAIAVLGAREFDL